MVSERPNSSGKPASNLGSVAFQTFVELPYRAVATPRQRKDSSGGNGAMSGEKMAGEATEHDAREGLAFNGPISDEIFKLYISPDSVSSLLAKDPNMSPGQAWKQLYGHHVGGHAHPSDRQDRENDHLERAAKCGHWGPTEPSELFLKVSPRPCVFCFHKLTLLDIPRCNHVPQRKPSAWGGEPVSYGQLWCAAPDGHLDVCASRIWTLIFKLTTVLESRIL